MKNYIDIMRKLLIYMFPLFAFVLCLFSVEASQAAKKALYLCIDVVIPSLFPFFCLSGIIMPYVSDFSCPNFFKRLIERFLRLPYYSIIIILLGFISGYPNGAKMTRDMFNEGLIDSRQATRLLTATNYCSPLFVIGTVGAGLFKSLKLGLLLLLIHWISGIAAAFITMKITVADRTNKISSNPQCHYGKNFYKQINIDKKERPKTIKPASFPVLLTSSIESSSIQCIKLTGYIVFFAVIAELLSSLGVFTFLGKSVIFFFPGSSQASADLLTATFRGVLEITSGAQGIHQIKGIQLNLQLATISLIFGFAGFSAHAQIIGIMSGTESRYSVFFTAKLIHGLLGFALTLITIYMMPMTVETSTVDVMPTTTWTWGRPIIVLVLLLSLIISPYRSAPFKSRAK